MRKLLVPLALLISTSATGEELTKKRRAEVAEATAAFVQNRAQFERFLCVARGENTSIRNDNPKLSGWSEFTRIAGETTIDNQKTARFDVNTDLIRDGEVVRSHTWLSLFFDRGKWYSGVDRQWSRAITLQKLEENVHRLRPRWDPWNLCVGVPVNVQNGEIGEDYLRQFCRDDKLASAESTPKMVTATWNTGGKGVTLEVEFDKSKGLMPVKAVWRMPSKLAPEPVVFCASKTAWERMGEGWVPSSVRMVGYSGVIWEDIWQFNMMWVLDDEVSNEWFLDAVRRHHIVVDVRDIVDARKAAKKRPQRKKN